MSNLRNRKLYHLVKTFANFHSLWSVHLNAYFDVKLFSIYQATEDVLQLFYLIFTEIVV